MERVLVLGHSGTASYGEVEARDTWPALIARASEASGALLDVRAVTLFPAGPRAVEFAARAVERSQPDIVILSVNAFPCAVPVTVQRVRFLGRRAQRWYRAIERAVLAHAGARASGAARRLARRVVGAEPLASVEEVSRVYTAILRDLAAREQLTVVAICEASFATSIRRRFPAVLTRVAQLHAAVRPVAAKHHVLWLDADVLAAADRDALFYHDGVHLSLEGNRQYAALLVEALGRLAPARA